MVWSYTRMQLCWSLGLHDLYLYILAKKTYLKKNKCKIDNLVRLWMWVTVNICTVSTFILSLRSWKTFFSCSVISQIKMSNWRAFCRPPSGVDEWGGAKHWAGEPSYLTTSNPLIPHNQGELIAVECGWGMSQSERKQKCWWFTHGIKICIKRKKIHYGKFFDFCAEKCVYN